MALVLSGDTGVPASGMPAGSIIQVVQGITTTSVTNSTQSYLDTGLTATITPISTTSKILVLINHTETQKTGASSQNDCGFLLLKNGVSLIEFNHDLGFNNSANAMYFSTSFTYLDSPASISALTYKTQFRNTNSATAAVYVQTNNMPSTITLMEIHG